MSTDHPVNAQELILGIEEKIQDFELEVSLEKDHLAQWTLLAAALQDLVSRIKIKVESLATNDP